MHYGVRAPARRRGIVTPVVIPIYFDYASTLCYIAWRIIRELEGEMNFVTLWKGVPIAARDPRASAGRPLGDLERRKILMVSAETGIPVAPPQSWMDSTAALEGSEIARDAGKFGPYHDSVFRAAFEDRIDIGDRSVLERIARDAGIDGDGFRADLDQRRMAPRIEANRREADEFSALGYPTFILGDYPMIGIQPAETMRLVFERFIRNRRSEPHS